MASPNSTFTEIVTTTLREHPSMIADNVSDHNALWRRLSKRNKVKRIDGGYEIVEPLDYAENSTFQRYSGFDTLDVSSSEVLSAAQYSWTQAAVHVVASGLELRQNSGKNQIRDLAEARLENAMRTMANNLSSDTYSDGTSANQIGGIQHIIQDAGAGTVGGINSTTYTWWKNSTETAAATLTSSNIQGEMMDLWLKCTRGNDEPDLIVLESALYALYWASLTNLQRYADVDEANAGFSTVKFNKADVFHDTQASGIPSGRGYFLNTNYLKLVVHKDCFMTQLDDKLPTQQDSVVIPILFMGNMVCSNRARQGVLINV